VIDLTFNYKKMLYYDKKHQTIPEFYERNEEETWKFHDIIKVEKYQV
jgi:hypothetical protein